MILPASVYPLSLFTASPTTCNHKRYRAVYQEQGTLTDPPQIRQLKNCGSHTPRAKYLMDLIQDSIQSVSTHEAPFCPSPPALQPFETIPALVRARSLSPRAKQRSKPPLPARRHNMIAAFSLVKFEKERSRLR